MKMKKIIVFFLLILSFSCCHADDSINPPPQLMQWKDWILEIHPDLNCPHMWATAIKKRCAWPGPLSIDIDQDGARFNQTWEVYADSWLALPGNQKYWPVNVTSDGSFSFIFS